RRRARSKRERKNERGGRSSGPRDYRTEDSPGSRARRFSVCPNMRLRMILAEEDLACSEVADACQHVEPLPTTFGETERQSMARPDHDDPRIRDHVIVVIL